MDTLWDAIKDNEAEFDRAVFDAVKYSFNQIDINKISELDWSRDLSHVIPNDEI